MVRRAESRQDLERVYSIRHQVFVEEQGVPAELECDEYDQSALHWLAWEQEQAVGTARLVLDYAPQTGKIGRVAVLPPWRSAGLGKILMNAMHTAAVEHRQRQLILDAQLPVLSFYERLGYAAEGEIFEDCGILHRRMVRWLA